jgi:hypothetical protein
MRFGGGMTASHVLRSVGLGLALILTVAACGASTNPSASGNSIGVPATSPYGGPPSGSVPQAPPRAYQPVFTGGAVGVEAAFRARLDAFERKDATTAIALSATKPKRADVLAFMNSYSVRLYRITAITVKGNNATIDYEDAIVARDLKSNVTTLLAQHDVWTRQVGGWKQVSDHASTPGIPTDLAAVTVTLRDHAPIMVPAPLPETDFAFVLKNTGRFAKGVFILGIPAGLDVPAFLPTVAAIGKKRDANIPAPFPDGVLEMGAAADTPAHGIGTMVFTARLPTGRYLLVSRTAGDNPSLLPKEYAVFTVV